LCSNRRKNKKLSEDLEAMKETLRLEHNRVEQVKECVKEELALARLIRCGVDRDLF
jgi:ATP-dependent Lon protease